MAQDKPPFYSRNKDLLAGLVLAVLIGAYLAPLLINLDKFPALFPKNQPNWYTNFCAVSFPADCLKNFHRFLFWIPYAEGGAPFIDYPLAEQFSPVMLPVLAFGEVAGLKLYWIAFFLLGALSMFYLCRRVLQYTLAGSFFSSVVFAMSGLFANLFEDGFYFCRETLLLPLLLAFFIKARENKKFLLAAVFPLALMLTHTVLFFPVVMLFLFLFSVLEPVKSRGSAHFDFGYLKNFVWLSLLTFVLCAYKIIPMLRYFNFNNRISGLDYQGSIRFANTGALFIQRVLVPENFGAGTMYLGAVAVAAGLAGAAIYFKKMRHFVILLAVFIVLSFGPNSALDLHRFLWHLPLFRSMAEISKYYSLIIVFTAALLGGAAFSAFAGRKGKIVTLVLPFFLILCCYADLFTANRGYFNFFNTGFKYQPARQEQFFVRGLNVHQGNESVIMPLWYFLSKKNVGFFSDFETGIRRRSAVSPRYYLLPAYAALVPSTRLLTVPNPEYKGEAYFLNPGDKVISRRIEPNLISIEFEAGSPHERLVLNQNFDPLWRADSGRVEDYNGLLSVKLAGSGRGKITLRYAPLFFYAGSLVSLAGFALILRLVFKKRNK